MAYGQDISIRRAGPDDAQALSVLGAATFLETYADMLPGADLIQHVTTRHSVDVYAAWLADPAVTIWLAQSHSAAPIGYLVLTPATLPVDAARACDLEVQRVYVLSRYHDAGIGRALMACALKAAEIARAERIVLGVHNDNARALAFYQRQGFRIIDARRFHVGTVVCCDSVLARHVANIAATGDQL